MTRIDNVASLPDRDALKKEIRQEIRGEERRKKLAGCGGCLALVVMAIVAPLLLVASFLAKTGFVEVPVLTHALYRPSAPVHEVTPFAGETADQVMMVLPNKVTYDVAAAQLRLPVTEQEITTVLQRVATAKPSQLPFTVSRMQLAIEPDMVELFAVSPQHGRDVTVRISFVPRIKDGELEIVSPKVMLGNQSMPQFLARPFFEYFSRSLVDQLHSGMYSVGRPVQIVLSKGSMTFVFFRQ